MRDYDQQLGRLQEEAARKKRLEKRLPELYAQQKSLREQVQDLEKCKKDEQADVDRLEGHSLAAFFYDVVGKKEEKLDKERAEAHAARVKYEAAAHALDAVEREIADAEAAWASLQDCEARLAETLRAKAAALRAAGSRSAEEITDCEACIAQRKARQKELDEAVAAARNALRTAQDIMDSLDSAEGWGTWDLLGGGLVADLVKHDHLDQAQALVEQLQRDLLRLKTELADVEIQSDLVVRIDGFLRFADFFFDGLFADLAVLNRIDQSQAQLRDVMGQIQSILDGLEATRAREEAELTRLCQRRDQLILDARL